MLQLLLAVSRWHLLDSAGFQPFLLTGYCARAMLPARGWWCSDNDVWRMVMRRRSRQNLCVYLLLRCLLGKRLSFWYLLDFRQSWYDPWRWDRTRTHRLLLFGWRHSRSSGWSLLIRRVLTMGVEVRSNRRSWRILLTAIRVAMRQALRSLSTKPGTSFFAISLMTHLGGSCRPTGKCDWYICGVVLVFLDTTTLYLTSRGLVAVVVFVESSAMVVLTWHVLRWRAQFLYPTLRWHLSQWRLRWSCLAPGCCRVGSTADSNACCSFTRTDSNSWSVHWSTTYIFLQFVTLSRISSQSSCVIWHDVGAQWYFYSIEAVTLTFLLWLTFTL